MCSSDLTGVDHSVANPRQELGNRPRIERVFGRQDALRERLRRVAGPHGHGLLRDDGTRVQILVHNMNSGATFAGAIIKRLLLGV